MILRQAMLQGKTRLIGGRAVAANHVTLNGNVMPRPIFSALLARGAATPEICTDR